MVYKKDFQYLKPKKSYLQKFETLKATPTARKPGKPLTPSPPPTTPTTTAKNNTLTGILKPYFREYCDNSSIHCFRYFTDNKLNSYERAIWLLIIVVTSICCIIVYFQLAALYNYQRIQTTVADSVYPTFTIPFPAVAICLRYRIDWQRLQNKAPSKFLPPDVNNETLRTFYRFFEHFADAKLHNFDLLAPLFNSGSGVNLSLIDNVDIVSVMEYLTLPCTEVFPNVCYWRLKAYNCCDLFTLERTELGFCHVFNSAISEKAKRKAKGNKFYPYHNSHFGESTGLEVDVLLDKDKIDPGVRFTDGIYVMLKPAEQWNADAKFINYNTFTKVAVSGQLMETDEMTRVIQPQDRGCIFEDEKTHYMYKKLTGLLYWRSNCRTRCHQEYVLKYCNCNLSLLFPSNKLNNFTVCKPSDFKCIFENAYVFSTENYELESNYLDDVSNDGMKCECLNNCNQLLYDGFYTSFPLEGNVNYNNSNKMVHLDVHFQAPYIIKYRRQMRYTFVELLANFGGIIGLFLGASLLSAVELIYYFTIGLYIRFHKQFEEKYKITSNSHKFNKAYKTVKISALETADVKKY